MITVPLNQIYDLLVEGDPDSEGVLHECRHCGAKFEEHHTECSVCESCEIATYEFEESR